MEYKDDFLCVVINEVLRIVFWFWMDFVEEWIGIKVEEGIFVSKIGGLGKGFVKVVDKMWIDD